MRKKKIFRLLIIAVLFIFLFGCENLKQEPGKEKAIPVYQGMQVTDVLENQVTYRAPLCFSSENEDEDEIDQEDPYHNFDGTTIKDEIEEKIDIVATEEVEYYTTKNKDFYITIKLLNPDNFVILSFNLNGVRYASYQFHDNSDLENIILKVNSGDVSGIKEYTVDEIKYVDGTEIKDVVFAGDRTVKVGVTYDALPYAATSNLKIDTTSISLTAQVADPTNLIELYESPLKIYLYDGDDLIREKELVVGNNEVSFDKLKQDTLYQYAIVTSYDSLEGNGNQVVILEKHAFYTNKMLNLSIVEATQHSVEFNLDIDDKAEVGSLTSIKLYKGNEEIQSLADLTLREFSGLLSNNLYEIRVVYTYDLNDGVGEQTITSTHEVTTKSKAIPTIKIVDVVETQTSIGFDLTIVDTDLVGAVTSIKLYKENEEIQSLADLTLREFSGLLSNNLYEIRVVYTYDLNDGVCDQELYYNYQAVTLAIPIEITGINILNTSYPKIGEEVHIRVSYNNTSALNIKAFYVNDQRVDVLTSNTATSAIIKFIPEFDGGIYDVYITAIDYQAYNQIKTQSISSTYCDDILILGDLKILSIEEEEELEYLVAEADNYLIINLENPTGYDISEIILRGRESEHLTYASSEIEVINNNKLKLKLKQNIYNPSEYNYYYAISLTSIKYGVVGSEYSTKAISNIGKMFYVVKSSTIRNVSTIDELQNMEEGYVYQLTNDIDALNYNWIPYRFIGILYGKGFEVKNLAVAIENEVETEQIIGMFTSIYGVIEGLGLVDAYISIKTKGEVKVGGLGAFSDCESNITNSYVSGTIIIVETTNTTSSNAYIGGLVGYSLGSIGNSNVSGTIITVTTSSNVYVGGLVGYGSSSLSITNSCVSGTIITVTTSSSVYVGGLVGYTVYPNSLFITNSNVKETKITVSTSSIAYVGGLVGYIYYYNSSPISITNSYVSGTTITVTTSSTANVGGLVGYGSSSSSLSITNAYVSGTTITVETINTTDSGVIVGGLVGISSKSDFIINAYVSGTTITVITYSNAHVGGLIGSSSSSLSITNAYVSGTTITVETINTVSSNVYVGGLLSYGLGSISITNSYVCDDIILKYNDDEIEIEDTRVTINNLNDKLFYINILNWSEEIWDLDSLDYHNNKLPKLKLV